MPLKCTRVYPLPTNPHSQGSYEGASGILIAFGSLTYSLHESLQCAYPPKTTWQGRGKSSTTKKKFFGVTPKLRAPQPHQSPCPNSSRASPGPRPHPMW